MPISPALSVFSDTTPEGRFMFHLLTQNGTRSQTGTTRGPQRNEGGILPRGEMQPSRLLYTRAILSRVRGETLSANRVAGAGGLGGLKQTK